VFHVSILKKYVHAATHVIDWNVIQVEPERDFPVEPDCILEKRDISLRNHSIGQVKVQWKHLGPNEATCELEGKMREVYPFLFQEDMNEDSLTSRMMLSLKGGYFVITLLPKYFYVYENIG